MSSGKCQSTIERRWVSAPHIHTSTSGSITMALARLPHITDRERSNSASRSTGAACEPDPSWSSSRSPWENRPQYLAAAAPDSAVSALVHQDLEVNWSNPECLRSTECTAHRELSVLVRHEQNEVAHLAPPNQLRMPEANITPRSGSPRFQSRNAGCSLPDTMSVAPDASLAKHRTLHGSTMLRAIAL